MVNDTLSKRKGSRLGSYVAAAIESLAMFKLDNKNSVDAANALNDMLEAKRFTVGEIKSYNEAISNILTDPAKKEQIIYILNNHLSNRPGPIDLLTHEILFPADSSNVKDENLFFANKQNSASNNRQQKKKFLFHSFDPKNPPTSVGSNNTKRDNKNKNYRKLIEQQTIYLNYEVARKNSIYWRLHNEEVLRDTTNKSRKNNDFIKKLGATSRRQNQTNEDYNTIPQCAAASSKVNPDFFDIDDAFEDFLDNIRNAPSECVDSNRSLQKNFVYEFINPLYNNFDIPYANENMNNELNLNNNVVKENFISNINYKANPSVAFQINRINGHSFSKCNSNDVSAINKKDSLSCPKKSYLRRQGNYLDVPDYDETRFASNLVRSHNHVNHFSHTNQMNKRLGNFAQTQNHMKNTYQDSNEMYSEMQFNDLSARLMHQESCENNKNVNFYHDQKEYYTPICDPMFCNVNSTKVEQGVFYKGYLVQDLYHDNSYAVNGQPLTYSNNADNLSLLANQYGIPLDYHINNKTCNHITNNTFNGPKDGINIVNKEEMLRLRQLTCSNSEVLNESRNVQPHLANVSYAEQIPHSNTFDQFKSEVSRKLSYEKFKNYGQCGIYNPDQGSVNEDIINGNIFYNDSFNTIKNSNDYFENIGNTSDYIFHVNEDGFTNYQSNLRNTLNNDKRQISIHSNEYSQNYNQYYYMNNLRNDNVMQQPIGGLDYMYSNFHASDDCYLQNGRYMFQNNGENDLYITDCNKKRRFSNTKVQNRNIDSNANQTVDNSKSFLEGTYADSEIDNKVGKKIASSKSRFIESDLNSYKQKTSKNTVYFDSYSLKSDSRSIENPDSFLYQCDQILDSCCFNDSSSFTRRSSIFYQHNGNNLARFNQDEDVSSHTISYINENSNADERCDSKDIQNIVAFYELLTELATTGRR